MPKHSNGEIEELVMLPDNHDQVLEVGESLNLTCNVSMVNIPEDIFVSWSLSGVNIGDNFNISWKLPDHVVQNQFVRNESGLIQLKNDLEDHFSYSYEAKKKWVVAIVTFKSTMILTKAREKHTGYYSCELINKVDNKLIGELFRKKYVYFFGSYIFILMSL